MPDEIEIQPIRGPLKARLRPPGSKSITNRAMLLAAMAEGRSIIRGALLSDDTARMATALRTLGFASAIDETAHRIEVVGLGGAIPARGAQLEAGNAGTAMRFLAGFLTLGRGRYRLDGSARMRERPIGALIDALRAMGIEARSENDNGCPPILIDTSQRQFMGGSGAIDASLSSQFVSALLMPAPLWRDGLRLAVKGDAARPFIEMTLKLMAQWGASASVEGVEIVVPGGQSYRAMEFSVEPDATAASYFAAAAAVCGGSIVLEGFRRESVQGDLVFLQLLERMGVRIQWLSDSVKVTGTGMLRGIDVSMSEMPDTAPTLAAIAPFASSATRIRGVSFIRYHESDRIAAITTELRRLGVTVEEFDDGLRIAPSQPRSAIVETYDDHRIAMAFAIAGLRAPGLVIKDPHCVAKTYPAFFEDLAQIGQHTDPKK